MSTHCDRHDLTEPCPTCDAALERARVVGVLDAWADQLIAPKPGLGWRMSPDFDDVVTRWYVVLELPNRYVRSFGGPTPDAARAAAAKAIEAWEV